MRTGVVAAAVTLLLVLAPSAHAAFHRTPIGLGASDGGSPSVVMDAAGTAHVAWGIAEELIGVCAIPRGARACAQTTTLALDGRSGRPVILRRPQDGALFVLAGRDDVGDDPDESVWAFATLDGVNWSPPVPIGVGIGGDLDGAALTADGLSVDLLESVTGGSLFQRAPLAGPPATGLLNLDNRPDGTTGGVRLPRRPGAAAQRPDARPARQPRRRLRLPRAQGRRPVRRRVLASVPGPAASPGAGTSRAARPARAART